MIFDELDELDRELRWAELEPELEEFQSMLASFVPRLTIQRESDVLGWQNQKGVYLLFDASERLLYIGFSLNGFGNRVAQHGGRFEWRWTDLIVFPDEFNFFAPALETFLIQRFRPNLNSSGNYI